MMISSHLGIDQNAWGELQIHQSEAIKKGLHPSFILPLKKISPAS